MCAKKKSSGPTCPGWMMTFGDCMSLLLCFFVLLMTFSTMNVNKLMDVLGGIQGALSSIDPIYRPHKTLALMPETNAPTPDGRVMTEIDAQTRVAPEKLSPVNLKSQAILQRFNKLKRKITDIGFKNLVSVQQLREGIQVSVDCSMLFTGATDTLDHNAGLFLQGFANMAHDIGNEVRVTVEYSPTQMVGRDFFYSPDILAVRRAEAIGAFLSKEYNLNPKRLAYATSEAANPAELRVHLLLAEKLGISEMTLEQVLGYQGKG